MLLDVICDLLLTAGPHHLLTYYFQLCVWQWVGPYRPYIYICSYYIIKFQNMLCIYICMQKNYITKMVR